MTKTVLITGGNSGIGYACAELFKKKGYEVLLSGKNPEAVRQAAETIGARYFVADMGKVDEVRALAQQFDAQGLDVLVNNAAVAVFKPLAELSEADFQYFFSVNLRGPVELIRHLLPALEKRRGSIVNVSSAIVNNGLPNATLYAATKGALDAFSRSLAMELAPRGIRVNIVAPGAIDTPIINKMGLSQEQIEAGRRHMEQTIPLARYGKPEEVAEVILAQAESSYVTGALWSVDGGVSAH